MLTIYMLSSAKPVENQVSDTNTSRVDAFLIRCILTSHTQPTANTVRDMRDSTTKLFSRDKALEGLSKHLNLRFVDDDRM